MMKQQPATPDPAPDPAPATARGADGRAVAARLASLFDEDSEDAVAEPRQRLRAAVRALAAQRRVHSGMPQDSLVRWFEDTPSAEAPVSLADYTGFLEEVVARHSVDMRSPRCFAHMSSVPPPFMHEIADFVGRLNQNLVKSDASRVLSLVERQTLALLHQLVYDREALFYAHHVQRQESTLGIMTSGGTLANLTALWCARNACFPGGPGFDSVETDGLPASLNRQGCSGAVIIGSRLMHYSFDKAAAVLGLGSGGVVRVPVDDAQRISVPALEHAIANCARRGQRIVALIGIAGTTDCGSIDPLAELAAIARREQLHFHVDAAWGSALLHSVHHRRRLAGIESADSVAIDGHKQFCVPVGSGAVLLRDPQQARLIEQQAPYMLHAGSGDLGRCALEGSRPGTALLLHASLRVIGSAGHAVLIERQLDNAAALAGLITRSDDFELLLRPATNIVLYRHVPRHLRPRPASAARVGEDQTALNHINLTLHRMQCDTGTSTVSRTTVSDLAQYPGQQIVALRAVLHQPFVGAEDLRELLDEQRRLAEVMEASAASC